VEGVWCTTSSATPSAGYSDSPKVFVVVIVVVVADGGGWGGAAGECQVMVGVSG
jgi:hypothetical protein